MYGQIVALAGHCIQSMTRTDLSMQIWHAVHGSGYSLILALAGQSIQGIKAMMHANFCITKTTFARLYF
jgi:hypothetical protein